MVTTHGLIWAGVFIGFGLGVCLTNIFYQWIKFRDNGYSWDKTLSHKKREVEE